MDFRKADHGGTNDCRAGRKVQKYQFARMHSPENAWVMCLAVESDKRFHFFLQLDESSARHDTATARLARCVHDIQGAGTPVRRMITVNKDSMIAKIAVLILSVAACASVARADVARIVRDHVVNGVDGAPVRQCVYSHRGKKVATRIPLTWNCPPLFQSR